MFLQKALGFNSSTMKARTEIVAGATTFLTMCYILAVNPDILSTTGMDKGALFTATAIASAIATLLLAFMAKLPFAQAPSMGLNAFLNIREHILNAIPQNLRYAISAGIGMFIAFIGLKNAEIIVANSATYVGLGKFTPTAILGVIGIILSGVLMARRVKGALFLSIIITTLIGIPMGVTKFPTGWLPVDMPQDISPIFAHFDFTGLFTLKTGLVVISLLMVNIFDTVGTLVGLAYKTGIVGKDGSIPHIKEAMMSDAIGTTCGAFLGSSTLTTYVESASGIAEGGRSGLTSAVVGLLFIISLFLSPLFMLIPSAATSGALVLVGVLMLDSVKQLELTEVSEAFPAFITMITMVLCYSIADGIYMGILSYVILKLCTQQYKVLNPTLLILSVLFLLNFILS